MSGSRLEVEMQGVELGAEVRRVTSDIGEVPQPAARSDVDEEGVYDPLHA